MTEKSSYEDEESRCDSANDGWRVSFNASREINKADTISRVGL